MVLVLLAALAAAAVISLAMGGTGLPPWVTPALCYGAGLALTLALASRLTPAAWWRRPTVRGLVIVAAGTWGLGSALAHAAGHALASRPPLPVMEPGTPPPLQANPVANPAACSAGLDTGVNASSAPRQPFRAHRSLNLRAGADVGSARLAVIPAGTAIMPTGVRCGDWWQIQVANDGRELTGWVSSLWLRRRAELENPR